MTLSWYLYIVHICTIQIDERKIWVTLRWVSATIFGTTYHAELQYIALKSGQPYQNGNFASARIYL